MKPLFRPTWLTPCRDDGGFSPRRVYAASLETKPFIEALGEVQRHALQRKLSRDETTSATIAFPAWRGAGGQL